MSQKNLSTTQFKAREVIASAVASAKQSVAFTGYFEIGDVCDVIALNSSGAQVGAALQSGLVVNGIQKNNAIIFDLSVDTSTTLPAGADGWYVVVREIDDGQSSVDRLYRKRTDLSSPNNAQVSSNIVADSSLDTDILGDAAPGNSLQYVDQLSLFRVGDTVQIVADSGILGSASVVALAENADDVNNLSGIELDANIDTSGETNVKIVSTNVSVLDIAKRLEENIDKIDQPKENEDLDTGNNIDCAFETDLLFLLGTSKVHMGHSRMTKGLAGTRAFLDVGTFPASNDALRYTSMLLGTLGNEIRVELVSAAGFDVTITKNYKGNSNGDVSQSDYLIQINNNSDAATAQEIADALNAHPDARRIVQVQYGGDGTGVPVAFGPTALAGGLNDGTKDYAELEQIYNNEIVNTGYKWVSFHVRPADKRRLNQPPEDDEDLMIDYRRALTNA